MVQPGPAFSVMDVHNGWRAALTRLGCEVADYDLNSRLTFYEAACLNVPDTGEWKKAFPGESAQLAAAQGIEAAAFRIWPDVVMVTSGFYVPPAVYDLLRARGMKVVLNHLECPYEDDRQIARAARVDINLINDPTNLERFQAENRDSYYFPAAYDPAIHCPGPPDPDLASDFCFVGTAYPGRIELLEACDWSGLDVALAGNWMFLDESSPLRKHVVHDINCCCDNTEAIRLYRATKVSANLYRSEAQRPELLDGWAIGPREVELAATGTFFLREARLEGDALFPHHPTFTGPGDFEEQVRWWAAHPDNRQVAVDQARTVVADRTFDRNARRLLQLLGA